MYDTPFVHRIPEILLEGSDVWTTIEQEEDLEEIQRILQTFIFSVIMQRVHHLIMEVCVCVSLSLLLKTPTYKVKHASMYESAGCLGLKHKNGITRKGRITHLSLSLIPQSVWVAMFSCTPGKWLLGLRVVHATSVHLTRTQPGRTIRVVPGNRISPLK